MLKAVIFDMDGVLVDSQPFHFNVDHIVLHKCGIDVPLETTHKYAGMSNPDRWAKYKKDYAISYSVAEIIKTHVETILELLDKSDLSAIPGIPELLNFLRQKELKIAVASSSSHQFIAIMLEKLNIRDCFHLVVSGEDMPNSKPAPDIFLRTASELGFSPAECVVIEDSKNGVLASNAAGIRCVGYQNLNSGAQDLSTADLIVDNFAILIENTDWLK